MLAEAVLAPFGFSSNGIYGIEIQLVLAQVWRRCRFESKQLLQAQHGSHQHHLQWFEQHDRWLAVAHSCEDDRHSL